METPRGLFDSIITYYKEAEKAYENWGRDPQREGVYAIHMGLDESADHTNHYQAVKKMTVKMADTVGADAQRVLDVGCGSGSVSFEIASRFPNTQVFGINISPNQIFAAQRFRSIAGIKNTHFSIQDYIEPAFTDKGFDRILFCESFTHASDKKGLLEVAASLLKVGGWVAIFDAFVRDTAPDGEAVRFLADLSQGWYIPSLLDLQTFTKLASLSGFLSLEIEDLSARVLNSAILVGDNSERRIAEGTQTSAVIYKSRLAGIATKHLMKRGVIGYYSILATLG